jgi:hypothetical protein
MCVGVSLDLSLPTDEAFIRTAISAAQVIAEEHRSLMLHFKLAITVVLTGTNAKYRPLSGGLLLSGWATFAMEDRYS